MELQSVPTEIDVLQRRLLQLQLAERMLAERGRRSTPSSGSPRSRRRSSRSRRSSRTSAASGRWRSRAWATSRRSASGSRRSRPSTTGPGTRSATCSSGASGPTRQQFQALAAARRRAQGAGEADRRGRGARATASRKDAQRLLKKEVDSEEIAEVVSQWTGIPVARMLTTEREKLLKLEDQIHLRMVDQDAAVQGRRRRRPPEPGRAAGPEPADRLVPVPRARPASARPSWPRPWPSSSSTARRRWSGST